MPTLYVRRGGVWAQVGSRVSRSGEWTKVAHKNARPLGPSDYTYSLPPWTQYNAGSDVASRFADGTSRNRLFPTGTTSDYHTLYLRHGVNPGEVRKLRLKFQGNGFSNFGYLIQFYNNGSTYVGESVDVDSTTGTMTSTDATSNLGGRSSTVTTLADGSFLHALDVTIPAGIFVFETRIAFVQNGTDLFIPANQSMFAAPLGFGL